MPTPQSEDSSKEEPVVVSEKPNSSQAKNSRKSDNKSNQPRNNISARSINLTIKQNRVINEFQIDHQSLEKPKQLKKSTSFSGLPLSVVGEHRIKKSKSRNGKDKIKLLTPST